MPLVFSIILLSQFAYAYPVTGNAIATEKEIITAGVTPDSFLFSIDRALDNMNLALTFNQKEKARKGLNIARERLLEVREMLNKNKIREAEISQRFHGETLDLVDNAVGQEIDDNSTKEVEEQVELEKELEEHESELDEIRSEFRIKIAVRGNMTSEQQALIDYIINSMQNRTSELKIKTDDRKNETKIRIRQQGGKSEPEIEREFREIENRTGLTEVRKEKALDKLNDSLEEISGLKNELAGLEANNSNSTAVKRLIAEAEDKISLAETAIKEENYLRALGLLNSAKHLLENAERILKNESRVDDKREEKRIRIEEKGNESEARVEIGGIKARFRLASINRATIVSELIKRTGLSKEEITNRIEESKSGKETAEKESGDNGNSGESSNSSGSVSGNSVSEKENSDSGTGNSEVKTGRG